MRHVEAKRVVDSLTDLQLSPGESLAVRCVSQHETQYGRGWDPVRKRPEFGYGSNNWGAVTTSSQDPARSFAHHDSMFDESSGKVIAAPARFARYATPADGARGTAKVLLFNGSNPASGRRENIRQAIENHNLLELAAAMRVNRYFMGIKPFQDAIIDYHSALLRAYNAIKAETGETWFDAPKAQGARVSSLPPPTQKSGPQTEASARWLSLLALSRSLPELRHGAEGDLVGVLQYELTGLRCDERFGPLTEAAVRKFQASCQLAPTGVVDAATWLKLLSRSRSSGDE